VLPAANHGGNRTRSTTRPLHDRSETLALAALAPSEDAEVALDAVNAVEGVEVLVHGDLEDGGRALAGGDGGPGKEPGPDAVPADAVLGLDLVLVAQPVEVPAVERSRVVDTEDIDILDLKAGRLELGGDPAKRARRIGAGEDILVHEEAPKEILVLPVGADTSNLEDDKAIIVEQAIELTEEGAVTTNANVFCHLKTRNLVEGLLGGDVTVVEAQNASLVLRESVLRKAVVAELGLLLGDSNTRGVGTVVLGGVGNEGTPAAANVEHAVAWAEFKLLADELELVVLKFFECLLTGSVADDAGGVDHTRPKEPAVEVVAAVVMLSDLVVILGAVVEEDVRDQASENVFEAFESEFERGPVVALLENVENITCEVGKNRRLARFEKSYERSRLTLNIQFALKIRVVCNLNRNLLASGLVLCSELFVLELEVVGDGLARECDLGVLARTNARHEVPVGDCAWSAGEEDEEDVRLEAAAVHERQGPLENVRDDEYDCRELDVAELAIALCESD